MMAVRSWTPVWPAAYLTDSPFPGVLFIVRPSDGWPPSEARCSDHNAISKTASEAVRPRTYGLSLHPRFHIYVHR